MPENDNAKSPESIERGVYVILNIEGKPNFKKISQGYPEMYKDNPKGDKPAMSSECELLTRHI